MTIKSSKHYFESILGSLVILVVGCLIVYLVKGFSLITIIGLGLLTATYFTSRKFTVSLIVEGEFIVIEYYRWFMKGKTVFPIDKVVLQKGIQGSKTGKKHHVLEIVKNSKVIYEVDDADGFDESDFDEVIKFLGNVSRI